MGVCKLALAQHRAVSLFLLLLQPSLLSYGCDIGRWRYLTHRLISTV